MATTKQRVRWVDIAKGLCILLIVFNHVSMDPYPSELFLDIQIPLAAIRVPLFFFCSGLFASRLLKGSAGWLWKKRMWPWIFPFTLWTFIYNMGIHHKPFGESLTYLVHTESFLWFLQGLVIYSVLTWLTRRLPRILVFFISFLPIIFFPLSDTWAEWYGMMRWWPVFLIGMEARYVLFPHPDTQESFLDKARRSPRIQASAAIFFLIVIALSVCVGFLESTELMNQPQYQENLWPAYARMVLVPISMVGVGIALFFASLLDHSETRIGQKIAEWLALAGRHTLAIYLCHLPLDIVIEYQLVPQIGLANWAETNPAVYTIIIMIICVAAGVLLEIIATRVPGCRWLVYAPQWSLSWPRSFSLRSRPMEYQANTDGLASRSANAD